MFSKAVIIGIGYIGQSGALPGCPKDAENTKKFLLDAGMVKEEDIILMSDDNSIASPDGYPDKENTLNKMETMVKGLKPGEIGYISYSGHGTYTQDTNKDEEDGKDEALCTLGGLIIDDEFRDRIVESVPPGAALFFASDSCHSGTGADLEFNVRSRQKSMLSKEAVTAKQERMLGRGSEHGYTILISGCQDDELSYEGVMPGEGDESQGAMTYALRELIKTIRWPAFFAYTLSGDKQALSNLEKHLHMHLANQRQNPCISYGGVPFQREAYDKIRSDFITWHEQQSSKSRSLSTSASQLTLPALATSAFATMAPPSKPITASGGPSMLHQYSLRNQKPETSSLKRKQKEESEAPSHNEQKKQRRAMQPS